ncbi:metallophosphoesterase family protein [Marinobacteraceae bacterium S3BR75-40.1]
MRVGVIADTHGKVRPEALDALEGTALILHAGDVGRGNVLEQLETIAPVMAIRGNIDREGPASRLPDNRVVECEGHSFYMLHDVKTLDFEPEGRFDVVIAGHSHKPRNERVGQVLYFNPGSAGPRRFTLPVAVGFLDIAAGTVSGRIQILDV